MMWIAFRRERAPIGLSALVCVLLCASGALAAASPLQSGTRGQASSTAAPDDEQIRSAWNKLTAEEQADALEEYAAESEYARSFSSKLIEFALSLDERDKGLLPAAPATPVYDPAVHAPAQPIARTQLEFNSAAAKRERERIFGKSASRDPRSAWRYDYALGDVVRCGDPQSLEWRAEAALAGLDLRHGLATALVERQLDDGAQRKTLTAFSHAYTDRSGTVYPGITLYDAWSSGAEFEMPDVDVLGIVHDVLDEWKKWRAPVPDRQHEALYDAVGKLFGDARRHRGLRAALAAAYLGVASDLEPSYRTCLERFHFAWESVQCDPRELAKTLPSPKDWNDFLAAADKRMTHAKDGPAIALRRIETVAQDRAALRAVWVRILRDRGAFERRVRPAPKSEAPVKQER